MPVGQPASVPPSFGGGKPRKVVISGWYGMGNLGDELILQSIVSQLRSRVGNVSITILSDRPFQVQNDYGLRSISSARRRLNIARRIMAISMADIFILGGGGILMDYGRIDTNISRRLEDMEVAQKLRIPNITWGIGVGEIWTARSMEWMKRVLPKSDGVFVRDRESAMALDSLGIRDNVVTTCDAAMMLPPLAEFERTHSARGPSRANPKVLVSLRRWYVTGNWTYDEKIFDEVKSSLSKLTSYLSEKRGAIVTFVPLRTEEGKKDDDREPESQVQAGAGRDSKTVLIDRVPESRKFMELVSDSDLLIGMRLHSLIVASSIGLPCIALSYDDKVSHYMSSVGAGDWSIAMKDASFETLKRLADDALDGAYPIEKVRNSIRAKRESSNTDVDRAMSLLEKKATSLQRTRRYITGLLMVARRVLARKRKTAQVAGT